MVWEMDACNTFQRSGCAVAVRTPNSLYWVHWSWGLLQRCLPQGRLCPSLTVWWVFLVFFPGISVGLLCVPKLLSSDVLLWRWKERFGVHHSCHYWNFRAWGFHIICSRSWRPAPSTHSWSVGWWCECPCSEIWRSGVFPLFFSWKIPSNLCHTDFATASLWIPDFTAGCGLRWSHCQTPKPMDTSKGRAQRLPGCGLLLWWRNTQRAFVQEWFHLSCWVLHSFILPLYHTCLVVVVYSGTKSPTPAVPSQILCRRVFFPPDPGDTAVRTCLWHSHDSALSWMNPGLREQTPDLELLCFSLLWSQNCFKPRQIYTVWCHLTAPASECKWHKEHVEQMEWDMHVKN